MKYTEEEVLDIIRTLTDKDPVEVFDSWVNNQKANKLLDLSKYNYPLFVYTFPIILQEGLGDGREVGEITLVDLYSLSNRDELMLKYLGKEKYDKSWSEFSHDTYLHCYLTINKEFKLPKICPGLYGDTLQSRDSNGKTFQYTIAYGDTTEEDDMHFYHKWVDGGYRFNNGVSIKVNKMQGWSLGEKINENIEQRLIPYRRAEKLNLIL